MNLKNNLRLEEMSTSLSTAMVRISDPASFNDIKKRWSTSNLRAMTAEVFPTWRKSRLPTELKTTVLTIFSLRDSPKIYQPKALIVSAKISINSDGGSRVYGFVCFENFDQAEELFNLSQNYETFSFRFSNTSLKIDMR